jgi:hypothetical protein
MCTQWVIQLTYDKSFGNHNMKVLAGTQAEYNKTQKLFGSRCNFPTMICLSLMVAELASSLIAV